MKKIIILLLVSSSLFAQKENKSVVDRHEVKVNLLLSFVAVDVSYEYLLNSKSVVGASFLYVYKKDDSMNYLITPYYRYFTGKKYASGFFVEGFAMLASEKTTKKEGVFNIPKDSKPHFGIGAGIGGKILFKKNFILEMNIGLGKIVSNENVFFLGLIPRAGISVGKRF